MNNTKKIKITLVKSPISCLKQHKANLEALGLRKVNHSVVKMATPTILGMIKKVDFLVNVVEEGS